MRKENSSSQILKSLVVFFGAAYFERTAAAAV